MAEFGSSDSGASLGDILGAAIRRRNQQAADRLVVGGSQWSDYMGDKLLRHPPFAASRWSCGDKSGG